MSSTGNPACGRGRGLPERPLRKPGAFRVADKDIKSQDDEKPPVQDFSVEVGGESTSKRPVQDVFPEKKEKNLTSTKSQNSENILEKAVNCAVFVPKSSQEPMRFNPVQLSYSSLASAVNAPEFVPGKTFSEFEETAAERLQAIENFVKKKIKQLIEDPGLLDELSMSMANYLSVYIKVENDMAKLSDILFEKCVSEQNFQYPGSRLANYLDKNLVIKATEGFTFRTVFLTRCSIENSRFKQVISNDIERACNVAIFIGELLMNYKDANGKTINRFVTVVADIVKQLMAFRDRKLLVCAGKLLKLTGSVLNENDEVFHIVSQLASDPHIDKTAQILFNRVCELRRTSWGQHEVTHSYPNAHGAQGYSMYFPSVDGMLEEQAPDLPVVVEEEWNEYAPDINSQDGNQEGVAANDENEELYHPPEEWNEYAPDINSQDGNQEDMPANFGDVYEELYRQSCLEQYGSYYPYTSGEGWSTEGGELDDYDDELDDFERQKQS